MGVSVIIAHYAPLHRGDFYIDLLKRTINSVRNQQFNGDIEIILCDDGSFWSKNLYSSDTITVIKPSESENEILKSLNVNLLIGLPDVTKYRGATIKDYAFRNAKYENIVVLDDDHPFVKYYSIERFCKHLEKYDYVIGRVIGPTGIPQMYFSPNAQGTTYAIKKSLYIQFGGFEKWLFENGMGEDNVMQWKTYDSIVNKQNKKACFAGEIITVDLASNRWLDRSNNLSEDVKKAFKEETYKRQTTFIEDFNTSFGVHPYRNPSRNRNKWTVLSSQDALLTEIRLLPVWAYKSAVASIKNKYQRLRNKLKKIGKK
jgi:hypothetical protein